MTKLVRQPDGLIVSDATGENPLCCYAATSRILSKLGQDQTLSNKLELYNGKGLGLGPQVVETGSLVIAL